MSILIEGLTEELNFEVTDRGVSAGGVGTISIGVITPFGDPPDDELHEVPGAWTLDGVQRDGARQE